MAGFARTLRVGDGAAAAAGGVRSLDAAAGRWPDEFVREVRERADVVAVVSETVTLRRAGRSLLGLCPFHEERTPSFTVSPERGVFHCFGCQAGGDVISFVMRRDGVDFRDAVRTLAERFGVPVPERALSPAEKRAAAQREVWLQCCEAAAKYFQANLPQQERVGGYLRERGITAASVEEWRLGYALPGWDGLAGALRRAGVPLDAAERLGLVTRRSSGDGTYDVFRDRLMFPIRDERGHVIGFGGRTLPGGSAGERGPDPRKYLNSKESPLFAKRRVWYGLHRARATLRAGGRAIIVEGYMDAITAHQHGFTGAVASLGTALSAEQAGALTRYAEEIVVAYDADAAGAAATWRGLGLLQQGGRARVWVLDVPAGRDPDDWLRIAGRDAFAKALDQARPFVEYLVGSIAARHDLSRLTGRMAAAREAAPLLARTGDAAERAAYVEWTARQLLLDDPAVLQGLVRRHLTEKGEGYRNRSGRHPSTARSGPGAAPRPGSVPARTAAVRAMAPSGLVRAQEGVLALAGRSPALAQAAMASLAPGDFDPGERRALAEALWAAAGPAGSGGALQHLLDQSLPEPERSLAARLLVAEEWDVEPERLLADCVAYVRRVRLRERLDAIRAAQRANERAGEETPIDLRQEIEALEAMIADLKGRSSGRALAGGRSGHG